MPLYLTVLFVRLACKRDKVIVKHLIVSAYRYIATTTLAIIAVFVEYLGQFLIDFNQIYRHSNVPKKHVSVHFLSFLAQAVSEHGSAATFFCHFQVCACHGVGNPLTASH